jgi:hypothetical protein
MFSVTTYRLCLALITTLTVLIDSGAWAASLIVSWAAPTTTIDGSALTDLASYRIYYGESSAPCPGPSFVSVASPTAAPQVNDTVGAQLTGLASGTLYYVSVTALNSSGNESPCVAPPEAAVPHDDFSANPDAGSFGPATGGSITAPNPTVQNTAGSPDAGPVAVATNTGGNPVMVDTTGPSISITSPLPWGWAYYTNNNSVDLTGTAWDDVGVVTVTWVNSQGGSGTATGTTAWTAAGIPLQPGANVLTVTAQDAAGNIGTAMLVVTAF